MKMLNGFLAATALVCAVAVSPASATTFVDTGTQTGNNGGGLTLATTQYLAGAFTLGSASVLTEIQAYIGSYATNTIRISLHANNGTLPGATLFSATFTAAVNGTGGLWQGVTGLDWAVAAGTYWVSLDNLTGDSAFVPSSAPNPLARYARSLNQGAFWSATSTNFGLRVVGNVAAVPEPATWGLMVLGFGMIGAAARSRKVKTTVRFA